MLPAAEKIISKYHTWLVNLKGRNHLLVAVALGACLTLALPPISLFPCAIVALTSLLWLHDQCNSKAAAFKLGWWFGFGHFVTGLYWISNALLVDASVFGWLIPFALFGIAAVVAVYIGITLALLHITLTQGWLKVITFAAIWTLIEMLRGVLFTGFPWNLIGYIWTFSLSMLQTASIVGIWGLSFIAIICCAIPYISTSKQPKARCYFIILSLLLLIVAGGTWRLSHSSNSTVPDIYIRIVQGNIPQTFKWDPTQEQRNFNKYIQLSLQEGYEKVTHIIWPETAIPYPLNEQSEVIHSALKPIVPENGALISGAIHVETDASGALKKIWNAALILEKSGHTQFYHKSHLVPFGEYIPLRKTLHLPLQKITAGMVDFTAGNGPQTFSLPHFVPFSPLICYEAIFPQEVVNTRVHPQLLINVTNDAWYGYSTGPFQHFESARLRAIEQGMPLIRAANTGISAVIDSYGRIIQQSTLETTAVIDSELPIALTTPTIYYHIGCLGVATPLLCLFLFSLFKNRKRHVSILQD